MRAVKPFCSQCNRNFLVNLIFNTQAVKLNMLQSKSFKTICCSLLPNGIIPPQQHSTPWVSMWYGDIYRDTKAVYDIKSAMGWHSDWVKANKAKHSVLNGGSTVECTESKISPPYPIKAHTEVEVSLHPFQTSALGWAWCLAVLTLGKEPLVQNE